MHLSEISNHWRGLSTIVIGVAATGGFWPGLGSFFVLDDYFLTAIARLVGNPWEFFPHSHMPGSFFYRPLAMQLWWLSVEILGNAPRPHFLLNLALHIGVSLALWRVLLIWTQTRAIPLIAAVAFAAHPIAIGTALGLSDRFDLLAALLGLIAIEATWRYRITASGPALYTALACATLAPFAKEIGFAAYAGMAVILAWPLPDRPARERTSRWIAVVLVLLALALLGWRKRVLGDALEPHLLAGTTVVEVLVQGFAHWLERLFVFVGDLPRLTQVSGAAVICGSVLVVVWLFLGLRQANARILRNDNIVLILAAVALMLTTGVLQAPTLRFMPLTGIITDGQAMATDSRMFYMSLIGLIMLFAGLASLAQSQMPAIHRATRTLVLIGVSLCVVPWLADANRLAGQYRHKSLEQGAVIQAAAAAVDSLPALPKPCQVYFLDVPADESAVFAITVDSAIKALNPDASRWSGCLFQTTYTPSYYILQRNALPIADRSPMTPLLRDRKVLPSLEYGGVEVAYLNLSPDVDATKLNHAVFLGFERGSDGTATFRDISEDVHRARRVVKFRCDRSPPQCVAPVAQPVPGLVDPR